jgi:glycerophosphoryl diester phosphodiesterase
MVKKHNMQERVFLQSFDWRTLVEMKKLDPRIPTVALTGNQPAWNSTGDEGDYQWTNRKEPSPWMAGLDIKDFGGDIVKAAHAINADVITPYHTELTKELIDEAHSFGMRVVPYTVNDPARMRELIRMGVDGIITDRPATLRAICKELKIKLPDPDPNPIGKPYYTGIDGL